jgi:hypothetical protein
MNEVNINCENKNILDLFMNLEKQTSSYCINVILPQIWNYDSDFFLKLLCFIRDPRYGRGNKNLSFKMMCFLKDNFPKTYGENILQIVLKHGCLKDLLHLAKYNMRDDSDEIELKLYANLLLNDLKEEYPSLAVKWAPRENNQDKNLCCSLAQILYPNEKKCLELYRKNILSVLSKKILTVERQMCNKDWKNISFENVPKKAIEKYGKLITKNGKFGAFLNHDQDRYIDYLSSKKSQINTTFIKNASNIIDDIDDINILKNILTKYDVKTSSKDVGCKFIDNDLNDNIIDVSDDENVISVSSSNLEIEINCSTTKFEIDSTVIVRDTNDNSDNDRDWIIY